MGGAVHLIVAYEEDPPGPEATAAGSNDLRTNAEEGAPAASDKAEEAAAATKIQATWKGARARRDHRARRRGGAIGHGVAARLREANPAVLGRGRARARCARGGARRREEAAGRGEKAPLKRWRKVKVEKPTRWARQQLTVRGSNPQSARRGQARLVVASADRSAVFVTVSTRRFPRPRPSPRALVPSPSALTQSPGRAPPRAPLAVSPCRALRRGRVRGRGRGRRRRARVPAGRGGGARARAGSRADRRARGGRVPRRPERELARRGVASPRRRRPGAPRVVVPRVRGARVRAQGARAPPVDLDVARSHLVPRDFPPDPDDPDAAAPPRRATPTRGTTPRRRATRATRPTPLATERLATPPRPPPPPPPPPRHHRAAIPPRRKRSPRRRAKSSRSSSRASSRRTRASVGTTRAYTTSPRCSFSRAATPRRRFWTASSPATSGTTSAAAA